MQIEQQPNRPFISYNPFDEILQKQQNQGVLLEKILTILNGNGSDCVPAKMTVTQASQFLNIGISAIYKMTALKTIPFTKREGSKKLLFSKNDLIAWMEISAPEPIDIGKAMMMGKMKKSYTSIG